MGRVNVVRVVLGGLLAGLVINAGEFVLNDVVLADEMHTTLARLGLAEPGGAAIFSFVVLGFTLGLMTVWLYAAIRPRYGAGPKTSVTAGVVAWYLACVYPTMFMVVLGMLSRSAALTVLVWELVEVPLAAAAGAWLYQEEGVGARIAA